MRAANETEPQENEKCSKGKVVTMVVAQVRRFFGWL